MTPQKPCRQAAKKSAQGEQGSASGAEASVEESPAEDDARGAWALEAPADPPDTPVDAAAERGASLYFSSSAFSGGTACVLSCRQAARLDRKSTRLNSSHPSISYAVF